MSAGRRSCAALLAAALACPGAAGAAGPSYAERTRAFQESLRLERAKNLEKARDTLVATFGSTPDNYDVALRLGWLNLNLGNTEEAERHYRRALAFQPGDPEAQRGLESVETLHAQQLVFTPSAWASYVRKSTEFVDWQGAAVSMTLPLHLTKHFTARAAYSHTMFLLTDNVLATPKKGATWSSDDAFLGLSGSWRPGGGELMGIFLASTDSVPVYGGALRLWAGERWGAMVEGALLRLDLGLNQQLSGNAFVVPWTGVTLMAGPRLTVYEDRKVSWFGSLILGTKYRLFVTGHLGEERWRVDSALPQVASFREASPWGGSVSALFPIHPRVEFGVHAGLHKLRSSPVNGTRYEGLSSAIALGMRLFLTRGRKTQ